ncbi:MAG: hypothetical protein NTV86_23205 [Planctomycetota bacterium]|nr:hypothetical protein [Planctomycetota bacterium]
MTAASPAPSPASPAGATLGALLRREAAPMIAAALGGMIVPLSAFLIARAAGVPGRDPVTAFLALAVIWVTFAPPILAAGPDGIGAAILRAGCAIDGTFLALLVLWALAASVSFVGAMGAYATLAAVGLAGIAAARCARTGAGRYTAAVLAVGIQTAVLAAPFALGGAIRALSNAAAGRALSWCYHVHPLASAAAALRPGTDVVWGKIGWLYWVSDSGSYPSPVPTPWYAAALVYLALAGVLGGAAWLAGRRVATGGPEALAEARPTAGRPARDG